ncbi:site-specific DNA-methyltransferase (adenine-specific) [Endobacter medicaginis]|uniref:Methyltransferase n=2 Tax=Endobacter medicaginis TaxID=1181271 RepID=A0A839UVN2_9PROT|nr:site-specific DNA-methyltransferase [Endobacter medicaginis]MBB3174368.1 site-specific DNA-methyltransferase (adenine-specific) [Endobacter medicaginis]MCX5475347.1 site-specific DNA-methyltransferase [Endobacter medicaginis]
MTTLHAFDSQVRDLSRTAAAASCETLPRYDPRARASRNSRIGVGPHLLYRGDCQRVLPGLSADLADVVITSPPYNIGLDYNSYADRRGEEDYLDWMVRIARSVRRVMKPEGSFFLNIAGSSSRPWLPFELMVRLRPFFELQNHITWIKSVTVGTDSAGHFKPVRSDRFLNRNHEHIFHLTRTGRVKLDRLGVGVPYKDKSNIARRGHAQDLRCRGDTWFIPYATVQDRAQKFHHPGTFPVELPRMCIRLHGRRDPVVLDPFMGTGTTLVAASEEGGRGIGIELDRDYVAVARSRLIAAQREQPAGPLPMQLPMQASA